MIVTPEVGSSEWHLCPRSTAVLLKVMLRLPLARLDYTVTVTASQLFEMVVISRNAAPTTGSHRL